ncbi:hypothetical protein AALD01_02540 [Oscillospiraceae bacterium 21-37]
MKGRNMRILFSSSISDLRECNSSFDSGKLRIAYTGRNRNNSFISKETYEKCISSIYNCPIVCHYDREEDVIGSHDIELVSDSEGNMRIVNITQPVGIVPESANYWWEEVEDESGIHEYLCVNVILWKRQEAYQKIKDNGVTDESMEISVQEGRMVNGVYIIDSFEFTAFCLLGTAEPCFESASLELFSCNDFRKQLADMMQEFKETFSKAQSSQEVGINPQYNSEGGEVLDEKNKLMAEYGLTADMLDFSINDFSLEELRAKFEAMKSNGNSEQASAEDEHERFELESQFTQELFAALEAETVTTDWGSMPRYWFVDYDQSTSEVYAEDYEDGWNLYGFQYSMNGDHVVIDFKCKKRKKYSIVDFDEGEQANPTSKVFELVTKRLGKVNAEWEEKFQKEIEKSEKANEELTALRKFKADAEIAEEQGKREEVLAQFEDLAGVEVFENLREHCQEFDLETLEEKCFAIRGRNGTAVKFSNEPKTPKFPVDRHDTEPEPYGGLFAKYGVITPGKHK